MKRLLALALFLVSCGTSGPALTGITAPAPPPRTPAPEVQEFHAGWCVSVLTYARIAGDLPTPSPDRRLVRQLDAVVEELDALGSALVEDGLADAGDKVLALSDAISAQADVTFLAVGLTGGERADALDDQAAAIDDVNQALDQAIAVMGHC